MTKIQFASVIFAVLVVIVAIAELYYAERKNR